MKRRIRLVLTAGLLVLAGAAVWWGRPAYRNWKQRRFLAQAQAFLAKGDFQNAYLSGRQVMSLSPSNLAACEFMAGLSELAGSPTQLEWRRRVAEVSPTPENRLRLASTALRLQRPPYPLAAQILADLRGGATNLPTYHVVSADLALRLNEIDKAQIQLEAAARLEPTNELHRLNLATLRVGATNPILAAEGRAALESLCRNTNLGAVALGSLINDAIQRQDFAAATAWSAQLAANPRCTPQDRLQRLDLLLRGTRSEFGPYLEGLKQRASTNLAEVHGLTAWLVQHERAEEALQWLTNLPPTLRVQQPVPLATAEACVALKRWPAVQTFLAEQRWADLEFMRFAFLSQASLQMRELSARTHWRSAVSQAGDKLGPLVMLLNLAEAWQRREEKQDLLWQIYRRHPEQVWTLRELARLYRSERNTLGLNKLFATLAELNPNDLEAKNNLAATSLLLNLRVQEAFDLAAELHARQPDDAIVASTYAFALHRRGRTLEGLAVMQKLKPEALEDPPVALYYGLLLSAAKQGQQANKYLVLGQGGSLLPEERALLESARKGL